MEEVLSRLNTLSLGPASNGGASTSQAAVAAAATRNNFTQEQLADILSLVSAMRNLPSGNDDFDPNGTDEPTIDFSNPESAQQSEKIPDVVKSLREFSGKPEEFTSWKRAVERILKMYECYKNKPKYYGIMHMIRHKIVGDADVALESYRTPVVWESIKKCLMMHYSDKRDISTLEYQMTVMTQNNDSIHAFYQKIYQHLSLILNKVDCLDAPETTLTMLANTYRDKALDTFIRGLNGDLPRLLSIREPNSLPQALHICLKLENMSYRMRHAHAGATPKVTHKPNYGFSKQFYPELVHWPKPPQPLRNNNFIRYGTPFSHQNVNRQPPPLPPRGPVPMEIDQSIRSARVNYQNRPYRQQPFNQYQSGQNNFQRPNNNYMQRNFNPQQNQFRNNFPAKRPQGQAVDAVPPKVQRNFHLHTQQNIEELPTQMNGSEMIDPEGLFDVDEQNELLTDNDNVNFLEI